jgi:acyl-coenzyme A thioesterase PaaI-like protein
MGLLSRYVPDTFTKTLYLRYFGFTKIPLLFYAKPRVVDLSDEHVAIKIPLCRRTRNHQGSMYFAALAIGADCCAGLLAVNLIDQKKEDISFIFKDFKADFYRRANADVVFSCHQGRDIAALVDTAATTDERVELPIQAIATVPSESDQPVARFSLTLSLKRSFS